MKQHFLLTYNTITCAHNYYYSYTLQRVSFAMRVWRTCTCVCELHACTIPIQPAGITLHANDNLPIRENNQRLVHLEYWRSDCNDEIRSCLRSSEMLAVISEVLISIPRNVRQVVGPSIFEGFTSAFIL